jgi:hypothetical protein
LGRCMTYSPQNVAVALRVREVLVPGKTMVI